MTYDQIEKMDKSDLVYAFKRMVDIAKEATNKEQDMEKRYKDISNESDAHAHIGYCEAVFSIMKGELESVIHVVTNK